MDALQYLLQHHSLVVADVCLNLIQCSPEFADHVRSCLANVVSDMPEDVRRKIEDGREKLTGDEEWQLRKGVAEVTYDAWADSALLRR